MIANNGLENKLVKIIIESRDEVKGFYTLLKSNYSGVCLPDNEYIVPRPILDLLDKEDIKFEVKKN